MPGEERGRLQGGPRGELLEPLGPVRTVERAWSLARAQPLAWSWRAWAAAAPLGAMVVGWAHLETGLQVRLPRALGAALLLGGWLLRVRGLASASHEAARSLWPGLPAAEGPPALSRVALEGSLSGLGLLLASVPAVLGGWLAGFWGIVVGLGFAVVRGAFAPAWLAALGGPPLEGGARRHARRLQRGRRLHGVLLESVLFAAWVVVAADLLLLLAFGGPLLRAAFGAPVALEPMARLGHPVVQAAALCGAAVLLEPLRAAVSAVTLLDGAVRRDALDLRLRLQRLVGGAAVLLALLGGGLARAEPPAEPRPPASAAAAEAPRLDPGDERAQRLAERILASDAFRRAAERPEGGLREDFETWVLRLWTEWLALRRDQQEAPDGLPRGGLLDGRLLALLAGALLLVAAIVVAVLLARRRAARGSAGEGERGPDGAGAAEAEPPWERRVAELLAAGRSVEALRVLLVALLSGLDRAGLLRFDPHLPNGVHVRRAPAGPVRELLATAVGAFDEAYYGGRPPPPEGLQELLRRARDLLADPAAAAGSGEGRP